MKATGHLVGTACFCLLLSACGPISRVPLIEADAADPDKRLLGSWVAREQKDSGDPPQLTFLHVGQGWPMAEGGLQRSPRGAMLTWLVGSEKIFARGGDNPEESLFSTGPPIGIRFATGRFGDTWIASILVKPDITRDAWDGLKQEQQEFFSRNGYWFLKYEVNEDELKLWALDSEFVALAVQSGKLQGTARKPTTGWVRLWSIELTDTQENLQKFFGEHASGKLFQAEPFLTLRRVQTP